MFLLCIINRPSTWILRPVPVSDIHSHQTVYTFLLPPPPRPVFEDHSHCLRWSSLPLAVVLVSSLSPFQVYEEIRKGVSHFILFLVFLPTSTNLQPELFCLHLRVSSERLKDGDWPEDGENVLVWYPLECTEVWAPPSPWAITLFPWPTLLLSCQPTPPLHLSQHPSYPRTTPHIYSHSNMFSYDNILLHDSSFIFFFLSFLAL